MRALNATPEERVVLAKFGLKIETAYMPVPRCATCKHWIQRDYDTGWCQLIEHGKSGLTTIKAGAAFTKKEFGCIQWEPRR